jgi:2-polyprenyl-6-methoxyphenol hydroxylase-like FAD-dependent oxidoreductase
VTDFENLPKNRNSARSTGRPVLVVGAGPTGLLLAAELHRRGVPCQLIDSLPAPMHWDRATVVHPRSLEVFESLGLIKQFLDAGTRQSVIPIHSGGRLLGTMDLSSCGSIYGFNLGLSEEVTESILIGYLHQQGGEVIRSSRLVGLTPGPDGAVAEIERDGRRYQIDARWVVGCDGIHSPTRDFSGIGFDGHDIAQPWAVFDATLQGWPHRYDATFVYLDQPPVILTALPARRWRVYLRPSSTESDLVADAAATIGLYEPAVSFIDVENPTRFQCHTKVATAFRAGAVLLAGDAAHLCSPAEGHGMNSGLQDAVNLAWKLALVYKGAAEPALLDSYEVERRPVAEMIAQSGDATDRAQTLADPAERRSRDQAMRVVLAGTTAAKHHEIVAETELNIDYSGSSVVSGDTSGHPKPGERFPDTIAVLPWDRERCQLHELTHRAGHTLVLLGNQSAPGLELAAVLAALREFAAGSPLFEAAVAFGAGPDLPDHLGRIEPAAADLLGVQSVTLFAVRPDGYIGLRADRDHLKALERYRRLILSGHP